MSNLLKKPEKIVKYDTDNRQIALHLAMHLIFVVIILSILSLMTGHDEILPSIFFIIFFGIIICLPVLLFVLGPEKILFYKNKFIAEDEYKYAEFQIVNFTKYKQILLKTENERIVGEIFAKSNHHSLYDCFQILTEFSNRGKEIIIDDIWYGIMPPENTKNSYLTSWKIIGLEFMIILFLIGFRFLSRTM